MPSTSRWSIIDICETSVIRAITRAILVSDENYNKSVVFFFSKMKLVFFCVMFIMVMSGSNVLARPKNRIKRVSDAHLADLQSRIALNNKVEGILITMPLAGGKVDPIRIGRRRRSQSRFLDALFSQTEDDTSDRVDLNEYYSLIERLIELNRKLSRN